MWMAVLISVYVARKVRCYLASTNNWCYEMNRLSITRKLQVFAITHPGIGTLHFKAVRKAGALPRGYRRITKKQ